MTTADYVSSTLTKTMLSNWADALQSRPVCECGSIGFVRIPQVGMMRVVGWQCVGCKKQMIFLPTPAKYQGDA